MLVSLQVRHKIQELITNGLLSGCRLNVIWTKPQGPHPIGNYEICCNSTSIRQSLDWFAQNHGNLSVLLHPSTRWALEDHTTRAMWLGSVLPLDLSTLPWDMSEELRCDPIYLPNEDSYYDEL
jgi:DOPA 4,5-dioxygenase